jgi:uncharacterized membrane protein YfcA
MRRFWPWLLWLACVEGAWLALVVAGDHWPTLREHWGIAVAMLFGSYVAGSTPMGGGTVGFPVLVLLFGEPAALGRDFGFAVQSVGMTSATLFVLSRRQRLEWVLLRWSMLGSLLGIPLGILCVAPHVRGLAIEVLFAVVWASFGVLHLRRIDAICAHVGETPAAHRFDRKVGFAVGLLAGATVSAITGVGSDMVLYAVMVLLMRADLKVAIPSAVAGMAFASLVGIATKGLFTGVQPGVFENWLAAAPVVVLGAPLGAFVVSRIGRRPTLRFVSLLCLLHFAWTVHRERAALGGPGVALALAAVVLLNVGFEWLWRVGDRLERRPVGVVVPHGTA